MNRAVKIGIALACLLLPACDQFDTYAIRAKTTIDEKCAIEVARKDGFVQARLGGAYDYAWYVRFDDSIDRSDGADMGQRKSGLFDVGFGDDERHRAPRWAKKWADRLNPLMRDILRACSKPSVPSSFDVSCSMEGHFASLTCPGQKPTKPCKREHSNAKYDCPRRLQLADPAPSASASTGRP